MLTVGLFLASAARGGEPLVQRSFLLGRTPLEFAVVPAQVQLSVLTQHVGTRLGLAWHFSDLLAVQVSGFYNYVSGHSPRAIDFRRAEANIYPSLNVWGALAGLEVAPLRGTSNVGRLSLVLSAGLGVGGTRHELKPVNDAGPATYGDTGLRFLSSFGGGFRLELTQHFVLRIEAHDLFFSDYIQSVNGCGSGDLRGMDQSLRNGMRPSSANVSPLCRAASFEGLNPQTNLNRENDVPLAFNLVQQPGNSRLVHNITVQLGAAFQF